MGCTYHLTEISFCCQEGGGRRRKGPKIRSGPWGQGPDNEEDHEDEADEEDDEDDDDDHQGKVLNSCSSCLPNTREITCLRKFSQEKIGNRYRGRRIPPKF